MRPVAGVPFAPEAVHHQIHELDRGIAIEAGSQQIVQLTERADEGRMIVLSARRRRGVRARVIGSADRYRAL